MVSDHLPMLLCIIGMQIIMRFYHDGISIMFMQSVQETFILEIVTKEVDHFHVTKIAFNFVSSFSRKTLELTICTVMQD